jgi:hypothetical protein
MLALGTPNLIKSPLPKDEGPACSASLRQPTPLTSRVNEEA